MRQRSARYPAASADLASIPAQRVAEHRVAERAGGADHVRAGGHQFLGALDADTLAFLLAQERQPAAGAAAERPSRGSRRLDHVPEGRSPRAARRTRPDTGPDSRDRDRRSLAAIAVCVAACRRAAPETRCDARSAAPRQYSFQSVPIVRTQCGQMEIIFFTLLCFKVSRLVSASCPKARSLPKRRAGSPVQRSFLRTPKVMFRCRITRANDAMISRPWDRMRPCSPATDNTPACHRKSGVPASG